MASRGKLINITPPPGIDKRWDAYSVGPKWFNTNRIRFTQGQLEKIGGWVKFVDTQLEGIARAGHSWSELDGTANVSFATECRAYVYQGGTVYDITPLRLDDTALGTNPFATTSGSGEITVTHTNHGAVVGDGVTYASVANPVNGITINSTEYTITEVVDANSYKIVDTETASSTGSGGGASVTADYTLNCGSGTVTFQYGYGIGPYGAEAYGTARTESNALLAPTLWSLDNWGEDLILARKDGALYVWDASVGTGTRAQAITGDPPSKVGLALVSGEDRHLICFGAHDGSAYDPMLVKWCDQEDYTTWAPSITNTAGEVRLTHGSEIKSVAKTRGQILILTDSDLYGMQYIGGRFTFAIEHIGHGCGVVGPNAMTTWQGLTFWMSRDNFYTYDGVQRVLDAPIQEFIFEEDMDRTQSDKVFAAVNKEFQEIWFFYQSINSTTGEIDKYVKYNIMNQAWDVGSLDRTVWVSRTIFDNPIAVDPDGNIWEHEVDWNDDANPMDSYAETGVFEIPEGDSFIFIDRYIPDIKNTGGQTNITFYAADYPNAEERTIGPFSLEDDIEKLDFRLRGRQFRYRIDWTDRDNDARIGKIRVRIREDGRRG